MDGEVGFGPVIDIANVVDCDLVADDFRPGQGCQVWLPVTIVGGGHEKPVDQHDGKCRQKSQPRPQAAVPANQCHQAADSEDTGSPWPYSSRQIRIENGNRCPTRHQQQAEPNKQFTETFEQSCHKIAPVTSIGIIFGNFR